MVNRLYESVDTSDVTIEETAMSVADDSDEEIEDVIGGKSQETMISEIVRAEDSEDKDDRGDSKGKDTKFKVTRRSETGKKKN